MVRRLLLMIPVLTAVLLGGVTACGDSPPAQEQAACTSELPSVSGDAGKKPQVAIPQGTPCDKLLEKVLQEGSGPAVAQGDSLIVNYLGQTWRDSKVFDNSYDRGLPFDTKIGTGQVIAAWDSTLVGKKAGSRVLMVVPPKEGYGSQGQPKAGIKGDDTLVFVIDILGSVTKGSAINGSPVPPDSSGTLPAVTGDAGAKPTVTIPAGAQPPPQLTVKTVVGGSGPAVSRGQAAAVQYSAMTWSDGKQFDSTWDQQAEPVVLGVGNTLPGLDEGLVGVKSGSRVLLVVPPGKAFGEEGQPNLGVKPNETIIFVVDVLGTYGTPAQG